MNVTKFQLLVPQPNSDLLPLQQMMSDSGSSHHSSGGSDELVVGVPQQNSAEKVQPERKRKRKTPSDNNSSDITNDSTRQSRTNATTVELNPKKISEYFRVGFLYSKCIVFIAF